MGCTALVAVTPVAAQDADGEAPYRLSPIFVDVDAQADDDANSVVAQELWVGGKVATSLQDTPASVSVITGKEIETRNAQKVENVLEYTPGIVTDYYGTDDRNDYFLVRGFQASTYRDGLTLGTMRGVREEPYAFERVEVLKGANSTLFGTSDPGGSVNYVTKLPRFERFGEAFVEGGSNDHKQLGLDFGDTLNAEGSLAYRLTAKVQQSGLDYDFSQDDELFLMGGLTWKISDRTKLTFVLDHLERDGTPNSGGYPLDQLYDRSLFFGEPSFNYHDVNRTTGTLMLSHEFDGGLRLQANLRYSDLTDDFGYVYLYDYAGRTGTQLDRYYFGSDSTAQELIGNAILQYDTSFGSIDSSTVAGVEFRDASTSSASFYGLASPIDIANPVYGGAPTGISPYAEDAGEQHSQSVFLQQNLAFSDRVVATVGLRHDWMDLASSGTSWGTPYDDSDSFSESSIRGALTYKFNPDLSTYFSYVESVAPPTIGVEPERGEQYEIGVKYRPPGMNALVSAAVYDLTKRDITVPVVQDDGTIERQLVGKTRVRGFDIEGKAEVTDRLSLTAGYSYIDSEVLRSDLVRGVDVEGNQFASIPNHMASLWVNYTLPGTGRRGDMTFGLGARYTGSYYFNLANDNGKSAETTLFDASFSYEVAPGTEFALNVSNLFDEQHVVGRGTADYYNPGRSFAATLRKTW